MREKGPVSTKFRAFVSNRKHFLRYAHKGIFVFLSNSCGLAGGFWGLLRRQQDTTPNQTTTMKIKYTVKTRSGYRHLSSKREALRIARIEKSDGWPTFVKDENDSVIFSYERRQHPGLV